jgi:hypothetical protein
VSSTFVATDASNKNRNPHCINQRCVSSKAAVETIPRH